MVMKLVVVGGVESLAVDVHVVDWIIYISIYLLLCFCMITIELHDIDISILSSVFLSLFVYSILCLNIAIEIQSASSLDSNVLTHFFSIPSR